MKAYVEKARVERVFQTRSGGWGVQVMESREVRGTVYQMGSTLWFRSREAFELAVAEHCAELEVGDLVNASGFVSVRMRDVDGEVQPEISLNSARLQAVKKADAVETFGAAWAT